MSEEETLDSKESTPKQSPNTLQTKSTLEEYLRKLEDIHSLAERSKQVREEAHRLAEDLAYKRFENRGTGGQRAVPKEFKTIVYPFDKYLIKIKLTPSNEFIEILEVKVKKDFLSYKQKMISKGFHDVDEFYKE